MPPEEIMPPAGISPFEEDRLFPGLNFARARGFTILSHDGKGSHVTYVRSFYSIRALPRPDLQPFSIFLDITRKPSGELEAKLSSIQGFVTISTLPFSIPGNFNIFLRQMAFATDAVYTARLEETDESN